MKEVVIHHMKNKNWETSFKEVSAKHDLRIYDVRIVCQILIPELNHLWDRRQYRTLSRTKKGDA